MIELPPPTKIRAGFHLPPQIPPTAITVCMAAVRRSLALIPVGGWVQKSPLSELDGIYPPGFFFFIDLVSCLITNTCEVSPNLSYSQEAGFWPRTTRVTPVTASRHWGTGGLTKSGSRAVTHQYLSAQGPRNRNQEGAFGGISLPPPLSEHPVSPPQAESLGQAGVLAASTLQMVLSQAELL